MPLVINVVATEHSNPVRDAVSSPVADGPIAESFAFAERGVFANPDTHSRTAANGGWAGVLAIARGPNGVAEAQRTWMLDDAQVAASGLTNTTAVQAFAQRLADDVHAKLTELASRYPTTGGETTDPWTVVASPRVANAPVPAAPEAGWSTAKQVGAVVVIASVVGAIVYASRQ